VETSDLGLNRAIKNGFKMTIRQSGASKNEMAFILRDKKVV
jgi:hypothetical protein